MKKGLTCLENRCGEIYCDLLGWRGGNGDVKSIIFVVIWLMPRFELTTEAEGIQKFQNTPLTFKQKQVLLLMSR